MKQFIINSKKYGQHTVLIDDEDFERVRKLKWGIDVFRSNIYVRCAKAKRIRLHRFILNVSDGKTCVDHKDHNGLNNQKNNLRLSTKKQNCQNTSSRNNSTSKYLGVCWSERYKKWRTNIRIDGKQTYKGIFHSEEDAAKAYDLAALQSRGEFANLNFPL